MSFSMEVFRHNMKIFWQDLKRDCKNANFFEFYISYVTASSAAVLFKVGVASFAFYLTAFSQSIIFLQPLKDSAYENMYIVAAEKKRDYEDIEGVYCSLHLESFKNCKIAKDKYSDYLSYSRTLDAVLDLSGKLGIFAFGMCFLFFVLAPFNQPKKKYEVRKTPY